MGQEKEGVKPKPRRSPFSVESAPVHELFSPDIAVSPLKHEMEEDEHKMYDPVGLSFGRSSLSFSDQPALPKVDVDREVHAVVNGHAGTRTADFSTFFKPELGMEEGGLFWDPEFDVPSSPRSIPDVSPTYDGVGKEVGSATCEETTDKCGGGFGFDLLDTPSFFDEHQKGKNIYGPFELKGKGEEEEEEEEGEREREGEDREKSSFALFAEDGFAQKFESPPIHLDDHGFHAHSPLGASPGLGDFCGESVRSPSPIQDDVSGVHVPFFVWNILDQLQKMYDSSLENFRKRESEKEVKDKGKAGGKAGLKGGVKKQSKMVEEKAAKSKKRKAEKEDRDASLDNFNPYQSKKARMFVRDFTRGMVLVAFKDAQQQGLTPMTQDVYVVIFKSLLREREDKYSCLGKLDIDDSEGWKRRINSVFETDIPNAGGKREKRQDVKIFGSSPSECKEKCMGMSAEEADFFSRLRLRRGGRTNKTRKSEIFIENEVTLELSRHS